jgi:hypothetical protein
MKHYDWLDYTDVFLDPIIVILTFLLGYWLANIQMRKKDNNELDALYDYFKLYLVKQEESIKKQFDEIKKQKENLHSLKPFNGLSIHFLVQPYYILDNLNKEHLVRSYKRKGLSENKAIELISFIELTRKNFERYETYHSNFLRRQNEFREKWNAQMKDFHQYKMDILNLPISEIKSTPELLMLNDTYNNWIQAGNMDSSYCIENLVKPLDNYFAEIYSEQPTNKFATSCIPRIQNLETIYLESKTNIEGYEKYLKILLETLISQFDKSGIDRLDNQ